jgi:hypothetical protein
MRKLKCLLATLVLVLVVSASALAGDTQGPGNPGETNTPPGETSSPPGETQTPPAALGSTQGPSFMGNTQGPSFADYFVAIGFEVFCGF